MLALFTVLALGALCAAHGDGPVDSLLDPVVGSVPLILTGPHVCPRNVTKQVTREVKGKTPIGFTTERTHCNKLGGCFVNKPVFEIKNVTESEDVLVYECCEGYKVVLNKTCEPDCTECIHGICTEPEVCTCEPNYGGPTCSHTCGGNSGKLGLDCKTDCTCKNNVTCDPFNGKCNCSAGWIGERCDEVCQRGKYGKGCAETCQCKNGADCNHVTGKCACTPGWIGESCDEVCQRGKYGKGCAETCQCKNGADCNHVTGNCSCKPGFTGPLCENQLPELILGKDCPRGWTGPDCTIRCPEGTFGPDCSQNCTCLNGGHCNPDDGHCRCKPGYTGDGCALNCSAGSYGDDCMHTCHCNNDNFVCNAIEGCVCKPGFSGENCDFSEKYTTENEGGRFGSIVGGTFVAAILVGIIVLLILYYRRRVTNLKTESHTKHSTAHPDETAGGSSIASAVALRNRKADLANPNVYLPLEDPKDDFYEVPRKVPPGGSSIASTVPLRNRKADLANPNVYLPLEDLKDPFYDVPKVRKVPPQEEYNHLDHFRPGSSLEPHYQQWMSNGGSPRSDASSSSTARLERSED